MRGSAVQTSRTATNGSSRNTAANDALIDQQHQQHALADGVLGIDEGRMDRVTEVADDVGEAGEVPEERGVVVDRGDRVRVVVVPIVELVVRAASARC